MPSDDVIAKLKADALAAAARAVIPKNPAAFRLADKIWALSDDFMSGRKKPSAAAQALARAIMERADRINRSVHKMSDDSRRNIIRRLRREGFDALGRVLIKSTIVRHRWLMSALPPEADE